MRLLLMIIVISSTLAACAGHRATWSMANSKQFVDKDQIAVEWPSSWMMFTPAEADEKAKQDGFLLLVTRDGVGLQAMIIKKRAVDQGFTHTKKKFAPGMPLQDLAEIVLDDIRSNPSFIDTQLIETSPSTLGDMSAFKLVIRYRNKAGLLKQSMYYGCVKNDFLYMLIYEAPQRYYYPNDLPAFEAVKNSFSWRTQEGT